MTLEHHSPGHCSGRQAGTHLHPPLNEGPTSETFHITAAWLVCLLPQKQRWAVTEQKGGNSRGLRDPMTGNHGMVWVI